MDLACQLIDLKSHGMRHSLAHLVELGACPHLVTVGTKDSPLGRITVQLHVSTAPDSQYQQRRCWPPTEDLEIKQQPFLAYSILPLTYI